MKEFEPVDWSLYGAIIRHQRTKLFYKTAGEFSAGIYRRSRVSISKDVLYRIEQNRQAPTAEQFMAINLTLFNQIWPSDLTHIPSCVSKEWRSYNDNESIPEKWLTENLVRDSSELLIVCDQGFTCMLADELPDEEEVYFSADHYLKEEERFTVSFNEYVDVGTVYAIVGGIHMVWL